MSHQPERLRVRTTQWSSALLYSVGLIVLVITIVDIAERVPLYVPIGIDAFLIAVIALFSVLTVELTDRSISWWFAFGMLKCRISLDKIISVDVIEIPPWTGYGIRRDRRSVYWVLGGRKGLQIVRESGPRLVVGISDAEHFADLIRNDRAK